MKDDELRLIASMVDWPESNKLMVKTFYNTFGAILHEKFNEFEETKKTIKEFIRNNFSDKHMPKTPKRCNPSVKLLGQIQQMEMANFDSDDSDDEQHRAPKCQARIPQRILQQLENIGLQNPPKRGQLQPPTAVHNKAMSGDAAGTSLKAPRTPIFSSSASCLTPKPHKPYTLSAKSASNLLLSASTSVVSSPISRTAAGAPAAGRALQQPAPVNAAAALEQQRRLREKEELAAKRRDEVLKEKAERTKRNHEERQRRVEQNNRLRLEQQQKQKQEMMEKEERLRKFRQEQEDLERAVRSPAAKSRKLGTPRSTRKPPAAAAASALGQAIEQPPPKPLFGAKRNGKQKRQRSPSTPVNGGAAPAIDERLLPSPVTAHQSAGDVHADVGDFMHVDELDEHEEEVAGHLSIGDDDDVEGEQLDGEEEREEQEPEDDYVDEELAAEKFVTPKSQSSVKAVSVASTHSTPHQPAAVAQVASSSRGHSYDMTPDKVFLPSTKENYNVDDLESGDETDNEENPRKQIPKWASKSSLMIKIGKLRTLVTPDQCEHHFGKIDDPEINAFFGKYEKKYGVRSSSAIWNSPMSDPTPGVSRYAN